MRTITIIFGLLIASTSIKAQSFTANELIEMSRCHSFDCSENSVAYRGFHFSNSKQIGAISYSKFGSDELYRPSSDSKIQLGNTLTFSLQSNAKKQWIGFCTSYYPSYRKLLDEFKSLGFIERGNTNISENEVEITYKSTRLSKMLLVLNIERRTMTNDGDKEVFNLYDFILKSTE